MNTEGLTQIIGKTVTGVVVKIPRKERFGIQMQVHLIFSDDTSLELYCHDGPICFPSGLDKGGMAAAKHYLADVMEVIFETTADSPGE